MDGGGDATKFDWSERQREREREEFAVFVCIFLLSYKRLSRQHDDDDDEQGE